MNTCASGVNGSSCEGSDELGFTFAPPLNGKLPAEDAVSPPLGLLAARPRGPPPNTGRGIPPGVPPPMPGDGPPPMPPPGVVIGETGVVSLGAAARGNSCTVPLLLKVMTPAA